MRSMLPRAALLGVVLSAGLVSQASSVSEPGAELLWTRPPEWSVESWLNGPPLTLEELAGRVVLVRWWTAPYCSFCRASAPALADFHARYAERGLVVLGFYHHKSPDLLDPQAVARWAAELGFTFPVAIDQDWTTLRRWWLDRVPESDWTSVTFLLDREGRIRHIHPGGQFVAGDADHAALEARIEELVGAPTWRGTPITMSFKDADLREVLGAFARLAGVNLVLDPQVRGAVTLELAGVPWDQALHLILKTHGLAAEIDGRLWAVAPR